MALGLLSLKDGLEELRTPRFWRDVFCEFLVDFILLAVVTMGAASGVHFRLDEPTSNTSTMVIALSGGLCVFVLIEGFGHIQWSVMNPVVGLVFVCTKRITTVRYVIYIFADLAGAYCGAAFVMVCCPATVKARFGPLGPGHDVTPIQAMGIETLLTMAYMCVILGSMDDGYKKLYMPGFPIGLTVTIGCLVGAPFSGPAMNPVVAFPYAALSRVWTHHWIYWCGDFLGGILAIILYHFFTYDKGIFKIIKDIKDETLSDSSDDMNAVKL